MRSRTSVHEFSIDADPDPDALLRVLGPFAAPQIAVSSARHEQTGQGARTVLRVEGLASARAEQMALRLGQLACVRAVRLQAIVEAAGDRRDLPRSLRPSRAG